MSSTLLMHIASICANTTFLSSRNAKMTHVLACIEPTKRLPVANIIAGGKHRFMLIDWYKRFHL